MRKGQSICYGLERCRQIPEIFERIHRSQVLVRRRERQGMEREPSGDGRESHLGSLLVITLPKGRADKEQMTGWMMT